MTMPNDPVMLLSFVNTQLRDHYPDPEEFCAAFDADWNEICRKLAAIDYRYNKAKNQFV